MQEYFPELKDMNPDWKAQMPSTMNKSKNDKRTNKNILKYTTMEYQTIKKILVGRGYIQISCVDSFSHFWSPSAAQPPASPPVCDAFLPHLPTWKRPSVMRMGQWSTHSPVARGKSKVMWAEPSWLCGWQGLAAPAGCQA